MKIYIIIASKNCNLKFFKIIKKICKDLSFYRLIIINDGSNIKSIKILSEVKKIDTRIKLLTNKKNIGQGGSIKKAIKSIPNLENSKILTMDDDGQHHINDVKKIIFKSEKVLDKNFVCFGVRNFKIKNTPLKSFIGNHISRFIYYAITRNELRDTQTGLRMYSSHLAKRFLKIQNNGFDFHNIMNFYLAKSNIKIKQINIRTIYFEKNKLTKFKSLKDSLLILRSVFNFLKNKY